MNKENIIECHCGGHMIELYHDKELKVVDVVFWYWGKQSDSLWDRIKNATKALFGKSMPIYDVVLVREEVIKLRDELNKIISE